MLGQKEEKVTITGAQAREVRAALVRALSGRPNEKERKAEASLRAARKKYSIEWR